MEAIEKLIKSCSYKIEYVPPNGCAPHTHEDTSEIIQTFESDGNIMINGVLYKMKKNGLYFINGNLTHFVSPENTTKYNHSIITFDTLEFERACYTLNASGEYNEIFKRTGGSFCELDDSQVISTDRIFLDVKEILMEKGPIQYARAVGKLLELLCLGVSKRSDTESNAKGNFAQILAYVSDHALEKIAIDEISKKNHISKYHLCRIFKENTGETIGDFLKERRLSASKQMLVSTSESITSIAQKCAFSDSSYFAKTFFKEFGITPSAFRKKYKNS